MSGLDTVSDSDTIVITRYPAARGAAWLREAFAMLSAARMRWLSLLSLYYLVMVVVNLVPILGQVAVPLLKPVFTVGFLAAAWAQERGTLPEPKHLFQGFRANLWALLPLGLVLLIGLPLAVLATQLVDGGKLLDLLSGQAPIDEDAMTSGQIQLAMLFAAACALPMILALWFAPALVVFHDCGAMRALALSFRAALHNWRPFLAYGALMVFYGLVVPGFVMSVVAFVLPKGAALPIAVFLVMPYLFLFVATLHISDYVSYRDIFHAHETAATGAPAVPDTP